MKILRGFSLVELLVVMVILGVLATFGTVAFTYHVETARKAIMSDQFDLVENFVEEQITFMDGGISSALMVPGSNTVVSLDSTCAEFLAALKEQYGHLRNPLDGSPLMTFSTEDRSRHKAGKIRITCYKVLHGTYDSGSQCKMRDAAIRVDTYRADCGAACGSQHCIYPDAKCLLDKATSTPRNWFVTHESNKIFGKLQNRRPGGGVAWREGAADCGLSNLGPRRIPKEPDY